MRNRIATVTVALLAAVTVSACSPGAPEPSSSADPDITVSSTSTPTQDFIGAYSDLTKVACEADEDGVWTFSATVKNSTDEDGDYTVTPAVVKTDDSQVIGLKEIQVTVKAGETEDVAAKDFAKDTQDGLSCVVRAIRQK